MAHRYKLTDDEIIDHIFSLSDQKDYGICPAPIDGQTALNELISYILGDDWYVTMPMGQEQVNHEALVCIELKLKKHGFGRRRDGTQNETEEARDDTNKSGCISA